MSLADCITEALELCSSCSNPIFNNQHYVEVDGQGPHMSCSYSNISMYSYDLKVLSYVPSVKCWRRFRDGMFVLWDGSIPVMI